MQVSVELCHLHDFVAQIAEQERYKLLLPRLQELVLRVEIAYARLSADSCKSYTSSYRLCVLFN